MSYQSEPIYKAIMGGEILGLQQAIEKIWRAHLVAVLNGGGSAQFKRHVEPAIYEAAKLLPEEMRRGDVPKTERKKPVPPAEFEDLGL